MVSDAFRDDVRRILAEELEKGALVTMANGIIDDLHCLKTALYRNDKLTAGDVFNSLDKRTRVLRDKLDQADDI